MEDFPGGGGVILDLPLRVLVYRDKPESAVAFPQVGGTPVTPLFTDEDACRTFIEKHPRELKSESGEALMEVRVFASDDALANFLEANAADVPYIGFDPLPGIAPTIARTDDLVGFLRDRGS